MSRPAELQHLQVTVPAEHEEEAFAILDSLFGHSPVSFSEPGSDATVLSLFLPPARKPTASQLTHLRGALRHLRPPAGRRAAPRVRIDPLPERDWKHSWKRHFKPLHIGRRLLIRPSWSRRKTTPGQRVVILDPGLSFGTGHHPTTAFCLRQLVWARPTGRTRSFLDIGTGSGILAIAAAKLGYQPIEAFDHDPDSIRVANANARRNRVADRIGLRQADLGALSLRPRRRWNVVCANLLADLLDREAPRILRQVKPAGLLVLAGILEREFKHVDRRFRALNARLLRHDREGEWQSAAYRVLA